MSADTSFKTSVRCYFPAHSSSTENWMHLFVHLWDTYFTHLMAAVSDLQYSFSLIAPPHSSPYVYSVYKQCCATWH